MDSIQNDEVARIKRERDATQREQLAGRLVSTRALLLAASERAGLDDHWRVLLRNQATDIEASYCGYRQTDTGEIEWTK